MPSTLLAGWLGPKGPLRSQLPLPQHHTGHVPMDHGDRGLRVVGAALFTPFASCVPPLPPVVKGPCLLSICTCGFAMAIHPHPRTETVLVPGMSAGPQGSLLQWPLNTPWW